MQNYPFYLDASSLFSSPAMDTPETASLVPVPSPGMVWYVPCGHPCSQLSLKTAGKHQSLSSYTAVGMTRPWQCSGIRLMGEMPPRGGGELEGPGSVWQCHSNTVSVGFYLLCPIISRYRSSRKDQIKACTVTLLSSPLMTASWASKTTHKKLCLFMRLPFSRVCEQHERPLKIHWSQCGHLCCNLCWGLTCQWSHPVHRCPGERWKVSMSGWIPQEKSNLKETDSRLLFAVFLSLPAQTHTCTLLHFKKVTCLPWWG